MFKMLLFRFRVRVYGCIINRIVENQLENNMEHELGNGLIVAYGANRIGL